MIIKNASAPHIWNTHTYTHPYLQRVSHACTHVVVNGEPCIALHGGATWANGGAREIVFKDLWLLHTRDWSWQRVQTTGESPGNRAHHCMLTLPLSSLASPGAHSQQLLVWGGSDQKTYSHDLFSVNMPAAKVTMEYLSFCSFLAFFSFFSFTSFFFFCLALDTNSFMLQWSKVLCSSVWAGNEHTVGEGSSLLQVCLMKLKGMVNIDYSRIYTRFILAYTIIHIYAHMRAYKHTRRI
jgi:hypothetical protein